MKNRTRYFHPTINAQGWCPPVNGPERIRNGNIVVSRRHRATFCIDYPLDGLYVFSRRSKNGWTRQKLVSTIKSIYKRNIYADAKGYGVWGHSINDLVIERIKVRNHPSRGVVLISMDIGS